MHVHFKTVGLDDFFRDVDTLTVPEYSMNEEFFYEHFAEKFFESTSNYLSITLIPDVTISHKPFEFMFLASGEKELEEIDMLYLGYEEDL